MSRESQKSVRFSPQQERRKSSLKEDPSSLAKGKSSDQQTLDGSPANSLTTNVASPRDSTDEDSSAFAPPLQPPPELQPVVTTTPSQRQQDKPNLHDLSKQNISPLPPRKEGTSYVETITYSSDKAAQKSGSEAPLVYLRSHPPELFDLIEQLEIEHFGKELELLDLDKMFSPRNDDEMKELTERLHSYIKKMRELRTGAPALDTNNFFKSVDAMEREMKNLKNMYEKEITKLRQQLQDLSKQKSHLELQNSKLEATASDLQSRMAAEADKSRRLNDDMNTLQRSLIHKEHEIQSSVQQSLDEKVVLPDTNETNRKLDQTLRENLDLHHRYEAELLQRKESEEKVHQLEEQISFNDELNRQQQQDLQDRLAAANTAILNLEGKVKVLDRPDHEKHVAEMLSSVRDAAERELYKYKQDAEETFSRNVTMLKSQMEADRKSFEAVSDENRKLMGVIEELNTKIRNLQGEIMHLDHLKRSTEENLQMERERSTRHIQAMEGKLKELQDILFDKMKELNAARIQNLPLKAEVESLRALIEEEEKRLAMEMKLPPLSYTITRSPQATAPMRVPSPPSYTQNIETFNDTQATLHDTQANVHDPPLMYGSTVESSPPELPGGGDLYAPDSIHRTVQVEPAARLSPRPGSAASNNKAVGPILSKSAQSPEDFCGTATVMAGKGVSTSQQPRSSTPNDLEEPMPKPSTVRSHNYNHCTNSSTSDLRIHEVKTDGKSVSLINMSADREVDIGGYIVQQQVGGHPVAVFRFPPKVTFAPKSYITIYSGCNDTILHQPPTAFVWKEQEKWGTGPECTTILCKPNGQAVAWTTAAHRFTNANINESSNNGSPVVEDLPTFTRNLNSPSVEPIYLKREKELPPRLSVPRHPHGNESIEVHPQFNTGRAMDLGNDNSSNQRQARSQSARPDKVPGELYAGHVGQRMGSSTMRRYTPLNMAPGNIRKNGSITNRVGEPGDTSDSPNPFMTPRGRHLTGLQQVRSQHHQDFRPPMPRPPLFSSW